jgi:catalase
MGSANLEYPFLKLRPERVVHARGAAAHGVFESYGTAKSVTKAGFLGKKGTKTDVITRFSTMLGSRGSADTVRDNPRVRGQVRVLSTTALTA